MESFYNYYAPNLSELPEFSTTEVMATLGRVYQGIVPTDSKDDKIVRFERFLEDFHSMLWFSYRKEFPAISSSAYTSDLGWGCMLRSGQMMLAQALSCHLLGRDWKLSKNSQQMAAKYRELVRMFDDRPTAPFSVHKIAMQGAKYGKNVGEWFGPSTIAQALGDLVNQWRPNEFVMYVSNDSVLYLDEVTSLCTARGTQAWKPLFVLVPLRLGLQSFNEVYVPSLKAIFGFPQGLGIIGGKPRAAMYFVAVQDSFLFYLDPHVVQPAVSMAEEEFSAETFHCAIPHKMPISSVDPSLAIGFYCADKKDFEDFWERAKKLGKEENPIVGVEETAPDYRQEKKGTLSIEGFEDDIVIL